MGQLDGKIALVTGGTSGIGLAAAKRFVAEGAHVYITGRRQAALDAAVAEIGSSVTAVQGDIAKLDDLDRLYDTIRRGHGRLDVLFANAGGGNLEPLGQITEEGFDATFDMNVKGTLFTVQKALPLMGKGGAIVLNGSTTGVKGTPAFSVYSASKAALRNFARSWALDLKGTGIRVNVLSPGPTLTPAFEAVGEANGGKDGFIADFEAQSPLGRIGRPEEVAAVALFLASDQSSYLTGGEVFADGGVAQV